MRKKRVISNIELAAKIRAFTESEIGTGYALAISEELWKLRSPSTENIPISESEAAMIASLVIAVIEK